MNFWFHFFLVFFLFLFLFWGVNLRKARVFTLGYFGERGLGSSLTGSRFMCVFSTWGFWVLPACFTFHLVLA